MKLSSAVEGTTLPPIPIAGAWIKRYKGSLPLLNLSQGVPGEAPPEEVFQALKDASGSKDSVGYGAILGEPSLRAAVAEEIKDIYKIEKDMSENVMITAGANSAYLATLMAICDYGSEVIMPCPWYFNAVMSCQMLGIQTIPLPLDPNNGFLPSVEQAEGLITAKTRAILLVSPNNPTGTTYPPHLLTCFFSLAKKHNIALIVDETYKDFVAAGPAGERGCPHDLWEREGWEGVVVGVFSFSKSYKIPGHRLGGIIAGGAFTESVSKVLDCMQICAPRPPQMALATLLPTLRPDLLATGKRIARRLELFRREVEGVEGWEVASDGGFYSYVRHPFEGRSSEEVSERLAIEFGVITLPGSFFMMKPETLEAKALEKFGSPLLEDRWIRFAVANVSDERILELKPRLEALNASMK